MPVATATKPYRPLTGHDHDFYSWTLETAEAIQACRFEGFDWSSVAEELEDMGRSKRFDETNFPGACPWTTPQILDEGFWSEE